jgi:glycosyltransferase involved in cell wall biosynthesis
LDLARTRRYESRLLERFERVLVTSPHDRDALARLASTTEANDRLCVLPNGVDLDYFKPLDLPRDPATIIFSGKMSYHANIAAAIDLARQIMPHVWQQRPTAKLVLAGKDPAPELLALAADPRIVVTGTVPDLRPYLAQATVAVSPIRYGVGIQNKVLEAMAMATSSVASSQATSALQVQAGRDLLTADSPETLAQAIVELLTHDALRQSIGQAGRHYVETYHDWNGAAETLAGVYQAAIAETKATL